MTSQQRICPRSPLVGGECANTGGDCTFRKLNAKLTGGLLASARKDSMKASEIEAMFHLINWATEQLPMGGKKPQSLVDAEFAFHNSTGKWPREVTAKTLGSIVKANAAGSSAPACSHVPVSAEDVVMKFWNDNRITLKERTDYFRWINAENERRANKVITEKST